MLTGISELRDRITLRFRVDGFQHRHANLRRPRQMKKEPFDPSLNNYIRQHGSSGPNHGLCNACNKIDFLKLFSISPRSFTGEQHRIVYTIPTSSKTQQNSACPLCTLFRACASSCGLLPDEDWLLFVSSVCWEHHGVATCLYFSDQHRTVNTTYVLAPVGWTDMLPANRIPYVPHLSYHSSPAIQFAVIAKEIRRCIGMEKRTGDINPPQVVISLPSDMHFIDCKACKVVEYEGKSDFLTLSYVLGGKNTDGTVDRLSEGRLSMTRLSLAIKDAIEAALRLGKQYLWVDRYCIDQEDQIRKAIQISLMAAIFAKSWATIVNPGPDAQARLPGVFVPRQKLPFLQTSQCCILGRDTRPEQFLRSSAWNSRAWTLQEALLSRRLVLFKANEVVLLCDHGAAFESLRGIHGSRLRHGHKDRLGQLGIKEYLHLPKFQNFGKGSHWPDIEEYCSRGLTYEDDSLAAFEGYLNVLEQVSIWGVPSLSDSWTEAITMLAKGAVQMQ